MEYWDLMDGGEYGGNGVCLAGFDLDLLGGKHLNAVLTLYYPKVYGAYIDAVTLVGYVECDISLIANMETAQSQNRVIAHLKAASKTWKIYELCLYRYCHHGGNAYCNKLSHKRI